VALITPLPTLIRRFASHTARRNMRQLLDCASLLALWCNGSSPRSLRETFAFPFDGILNTNCISPDYGERS
jgi:hypothetical protein